MFFESCMRWLMTKIYIVFFLPYSPATLKPGMTALKSLLHDSEIGKSQASSIICAFCLYWYTGICTSIQAHAHTHIQCDQSLGFISIWGFTESSLYLNWFADSFRVCMCILIWTSIRGNKRYKFWQHNQNLISMEIWDWWGCLLLVNTAENQNLS